MDSSELPPQQKRSNRAAYWVIGACLAFGLTIQIIIWGLGFFEVPLREDVDAEAINSAATELRDERSQHKTEGDLERLLQSLEATWKVLDDSRGGHFFATSKNPDNKVFLGETQKEQLVSLLAELRLNPVVLAAGVYPPGKSAPPQQVRIERCAELSLSLAEAYRRLATRTKRIDVDVCIDQVETSLRLLRIPSQRASFETLQRVAQNHQYLGQVGRDAIYAAGDGTATERMVKVMAEQFRHYPNMDRAFEQFILKSWQWFDPEVKKQEADIIESSRYRADVFPQIEYLRRLKLLARVQPFPPQNWEIEVEELGTWLDNAEFHAPCRANVEYYWEAMNHFESMYQELRDMLQ